MAMPISSERRAEYPDGWDEFSLSIRRDRAGWRCECEGECGHDHTIEKWYWPASDDYGGEFEDKTGDARCSAMHGALHWITDSKVVLTVAHLDHDHTHKDPERVRAMCQRCHLAYDADQHRRSAQTTRHRRRALGDLFGGA